MPVRSSPPTCVRRRGRRHARRRRTAPHLARPVSGPAQHFRALGPGQAVDPCGAHMAIGHLVLGEPAPGGMTAVQPRRRSPWRPRRRLHTPRRRSDRRPRGHAPLRDATPPWPTASSGAARTGSAPFGHARRAATSGCDCGETCYPVGRDNAEARGCVDRSHPLIDVTFTTPCGAISRTLPMSGLPSCPRPNFLANGRRASCRPVSTRDSAGPPLARRAARAGRRRFPAELRSLAPHS